MAARVNGLFRGIFAGESFTLSQSYYYGSVNGNPDHQVEVIDGTPIDALDELDEIAIGKPNTKAGNGADHSWTGGIVDEPALLEEIRTGAAYHTPAMRLLGHWALHGVAMLDANARLSAAFNSIPEADRNQRWRDRVQSIPDMLAYIWPKEAEKRDSRANGLDPTGTVNDNKALFDTAKLFLSSHFVEHGAATLHHHRAGFYWWNGTAHRAGRSSAALAYVRFPRPMRCGRLER
jgi:hypothetical protein